MPRQLSEQLRQTVARELLQLQTVDSIASTVKPAGPDSWSPREELGHLIDSAANNHQRFVRAAAGQEFRGPGYAQNAWVDLHGYQEMEWSAIVAFWSQYNNFLADLVNRIAEDKLKTLCYIGESKPVSLGFVIEDYILHMQHHLDHLLSRPVITPYPAVAKP